MITYEQCLYIPDNNSLELKVTYQCHDAKVAGHFVPDRSLELMKCDYYWPEIGDWVRNHIHMCDACQRNQTIRHKKYGKLIPLPIPYQPWEQISMDSITDLPNTKVYNPYCVVVDRFTKIAQFIPVKNRKVKELAGILVHEIWRRDASLKRIVWDRDMVLICSFWQKVMEFLEVVLDKSSAYHAQTDGQTE